MHRVAMFLLLAAVVGAAPLGADSVVLKNGGRLDGIVIDRGDRVRIETEFGAVEMPKDMIREVLPGSTKLQEYRTRAAALTDTDVAGHFALGQWAKANELEAMARKEFDRVLALDPSHEGAHRQLGHEQVDGRWLTHDEAMRARGFVQSDGQWITKEEAELRQALARESELREQVRVAENRERRRRDELARQEALADARLAALEQENARLRYAQQRRSYSGGYYGGYGGVSYPANYGYGPYYGSYANAAPSYYPVSATGGPVQYLDGTGQPVSFGQSATGAATWFTPSGPLHASDDGHTVAFDAGSGGYTHMTRGETDITLTPSQPVYNYNYNVIRAVPNYPVYGSGFGLFLRF